MHTQQHKTEAAERRAYRITEFCSVWRVSRTTAWRWLKTGELIGIPAGGRTLISRESPWLKRAEAAK